MGDIRENAHLVYVYTYVSEAVPFFPFAVGATGRSFCEESVPSSEAVSLALSSLENIFRDLEEFESKSRMRRLPSTYRNTDLE